MGLINKVKFFNSKKIIVIIIYFCFLAQFSAINVLAASSSKSVSKKKGEVKALTTITIPATYVESGLQASGQWLDTGSVGSRFYVPYSTVGIGQWNGYIGGDPFFIKSFTQEVTAVFSLSSIPAGQSIISASVAFSLACSDGRSTSISGYNVNGMTDPRNVTARPDWRILYAGGSPIGTASSCTPGNVSLGSAGAAQIQAARSSVNIYSLGFTSTGGFAALSNPQLTVTYGTREVDLKVNGSDGPVTVTAGSNINLAWSSTGFTNCTYGSSPAWYTNGWKSGDTSAPTAGPASTKIYYEDVTYSITCKDSGSGNTISDQVLVNVVSP